MVCPVLHWNQGELAVATVQGLGPPHTHAGGHWQAAGHHQPKQAGKVEDCQAVALRKAQRAGFLATNQPAG